MLEARAKVLRLSPVYRTAPMYVLNQPDFLNGAALLETDLGPRSLLATLKEIEDRMGREKSARYGPREIDLDLVAFGCLSYQYVGGERDLTVPHPKLAERRFVLAPSYDVAPDWHFPGLGDVRSLLARTESDADAVLKLNDAAIHLQGN